MKGVDLIDLREYQDFTFRTILSSVHSFPEIEILTMKM
jgi:hypothetical protein